MRIQGISSKQTFGITTGEFREMLSKVTILPIPTSSASERDISRGIASAHFQSLVDSSPLFKQMCERVGSFLFKPLN